MGYSQHLILIKSETSRFLIKLMHSYFLNETHKKKPLCLCFPPQVDLDSRHMGWVTSELPGGDHHVIKVELKGPENTLRVRQVKVLGWKEGESIKIPGQISASMAQQKNCEAETLRVFRLITSQVSTTLPSFSFAHIRYLRD